MWTYHIGPGVLGGQHLTGLGGGHLELGDDGDGLDLRCPGELDVVANADGGLWRLDSSVDASCRGREHLTKGNLLAGHVFWLQGFEIRPDEAAVESCSDIVRVALCSRELGCYLCWCLDCVLAHLS